MVKLTEEMIVARTRVSDMGNVKKLNCWGAELTDITVIRKLINVEVLSLSVNCITTLSDIQFCKNLQELYIRKNRIQNLEEIIWLKDCPRLRNLWLEENPCVGQSQHADLYRLTVIKNLPQLQKLDNVAVSSEELAEALRRGVDLSHPLDRDASSTEHYYDQYPGGSSREPTGYEEEQPVSVHGSRRQSVVNAAHNDQYSGPSRRVSNQVFDAANEIPPSGPPPPAAVVPGGPTSSTSTTSSSSPSALRSSSSSSDQGYGRRSSHHSMTNTGNSYVDDYGRRYSHQEVQQLRRSAGPPEVVGRRRDEELDERNANNYEMVERQMRNSCGISSGYSSHQPPPPQDYGYHHHHHQGGGGGYEYSRNGSSYKSAKVNHDQRSLINGESESLGTNLTELSRSSSSNFGGGNGGGGNGSLHHSSSHQFHNGGGGGSRANNGPTSLNISGCSNSTPTRASPCPSEEARSVVAQHYDSTYQQVNQQIESARQLISQQRQVASPERPYPRRPKNRNSNILSAVLCLIKELDGPSLEVAEMAVRCRMEELED